MTAAAAFVVAGTLSRALADDVVQPGDLIRPADVAAGGNACEPCDEQLLAPDPSVVRDACGDCEHCPAWTFRGGAVRLQRRTDPPRPLAVRHPVYGVTETVLDASQLNYPLRGGPDFDLIRHGESADLEFRFFAVDQSSSASTRPLPTPRSLCFPRR